MIGAILSHSVFQFLDFSLFLLPHPLGCRRIIQVDAAHWWWLKRDPLMIVKRFGCTTIHNKALYKCFIHSFIHSLSFGLCLPLPGLLPCIWIVSLCFAPPGLCSPPIDPVCSLDCSCVFALAIPVCWCFNLACVFDHVSV